MARRYARRVDSTQREIVETLEAVCGVSGVQKIDPVGGAQAGVPDLLVGFRGVNYLIEVKSPGGSLSVKQEEWHDAWPGARVAVVSTPAEALAAIGLRARASH